MPSLVTPWQAIKKGISESYEDHSMGIRCFWSIPESQSVGHTRPSPAEVRIYSPSPSPNQFKKRFLCVGYHIVSHMSQLSLTITLRVIPLLEMIKLKSKEVETFV